MIYTSDHVTAAIMQFNTCRAVVSCIMQMRKVASVFSCGGHLGSVVLLADIMLNADGVLASGRSNRANDDVAIFVHVLII